MEVCEDNDEALVEDHLSTPKIGTCLGNLEVTAAIEKHVLDRLVKSNETLVEELGALNKKKIS